MSNPSFEIEKHGSLKLPNINQQAVGSQHVAVKTNVQFILEDNLLQIDFECEDDPFVNQNYYTENNTEMWNQEVFELFLAKGKKIPNQYIEIEVNPNAALFVAIVQNPTGKKPEDLLFLEPEEAGVKATVTKSENSWAGTLSFPLSILGDVEDFYQFNLYRIVAKTLPNGPKWACDSDNAHFLCLNATMSGAQPNFHIPSKFASLQIKNKEEL